MRKGIIAAVLLAALPLGAFASDGAADGAPVPGAGTKSIVVYFSATGNTKAAAEKIAKLTGSEIMEIEPAEKYTDADLNWHDGESRSSVEMNDESSRARPSATTARCSLAIPSGGARLRGSSTPLWRSMTSRGGP